MSRESRRKDLRALMEKRGLGAILLQRHANFAWYTGGADNRVDHAAQDGVASIVITPDGEYVLTNNVEAPRMREEQTPRLEIVEHPWYEGPADALRELAGGREIGGDLPADDIRDVSYEISPLRYVLDAVAREQYRLLGRDTATAMEEVAADLAPDTDEREAAAGLLSACAGRGMFAPVLLAASDDRMRRYRHPIPRGGALGPRAMLVVCAERGGLYANLTRVLRFEEPDPETAGRERACDNVLRRMMDATRPGRALSDVFSDCRRFYAAEGYPDAWKEHHQGGLTGYASREVIASPETPLQISDGQAFAWNPSLVGAKAENTFLLNAEGPETLT